jgi:hypothetical protein
MGMAAAPCPDERHQSVKLSDVTNLPKTYRASIPTPNIAVSDA